MKNLLQIASNSNYLIECLFNISLICLVNELSLSLFLYIRMYNKPKPHKHRTKFQSEMRSNNVLTICEIAFSCFQTIAKSQMIIAEWVQQWSYLNDEKTANDQTKTQTLAHETQSMPISMLDIDRRACSQSRNKEPDKRSNLIFVQLFILQSLLSERLHTEHESFKISYIL